MAAAAHQATAQQMAANDSSSSGDKRSEEANMENIGVAAAEAGRQGVPSSRVLHYLPCWTFV